MSKTMPFGLLCRLAVAGAVLSGLAGVAHAAQVGVAAAVNPDAFSSLNGAPQSQLNIGKSIFYNERINTTGSGLVQVLLVDGSTFTVGPGSDLVIDKFVYNPNKGSGEITASFTKGVMRFVGGKISKNDDAVSINTPAGALAIRGCIVMGQVKSPSNYGFLLVYGEYMKMKGQTVFQPGNGFFATNGQVTMGLPPKNFVNGLMAGLTNGNPGTGNPNPGPADGGTKPGTQYTKVETLSLQDLIADATTDQINGDLDKQEQQASVDTTDTPPPTDTTDDTPPCVDCEGTPSGKLEGYSGGVFVQNPPDENGETVGVVANLNSKHVSFTFNDDEETFSAVFKLSAGGIAGHQGGAEIKFGDATSNPESPNSFTSQYGFAALSQPDGVKIFHDDNSEARIIGTPFAALVSAGYGYSDGYPNYSYNHYEDNQLPSFNQVLCTDCDFLKWGIYVASVGFEDAQDGGEPIDRNVGIIGWWVAGDIPPVGQLPITGTATYNGGAIATVATTLVPSENSLNGWTTYIATGQVDMSWNFGTRKGDFTISQFDSAHFNSGQGLTFSGPMCAPAVTGCGSNTPGGNHFGGSLTGQLPANLNLSSAERNLTGFALGSFVRGPSNFDTNGVAINRSIPQGVIGNWGVGNDRYLASGIFAGTHAVPSQ